MENIQGTDNQIHCKINFANRYHSFVSSFADAADELKKKNSHVTNFNHQLWLHIKPQGSHDNLCKNDCS